MEEPEDERQTTDDSTYWDNIVEELLNIDTNRSVPYRSREPSISITPAEPDLQVDQEVTDEEEVCDVHTRPGPSSPFLDRPYIYEDGDSESFLSAANSETNLCEDPESEEHYEETTSRNEIEYSLHDVLLSPPTEGDLGDCIVDEELESKGSLNGTRDEDELDLCTDSSDIPDECKQEHLLLCDLIKSDDMDGVTDFIANNSDEIGDICLVSDDSGTSPVTAAASLGSLNILKQLADAGVWLSCTDGEGKMAIHRAIENGHNDIVEWLALHGQWTGMTKSGMLAIHLAAQSGQFQAVNILLRVAQNVDEESSVGRKTPLELAVLNGHADICELLIGRGADVNHVNSLGQTALHIAAEAGQAALVDLLIMYGADVNSRISTSGKTPLHLTVENNHYQTASKLLEADADVDIKDAQGETVLHKLHASDLPIDSIGAICRQSKNIDARNRRNRSALFLAVETGNIDASLVLIQNHSNVNLEISTGCSPLYAATHYGHWDIVDKLILAGANVNKQTDNGSTALYKAARNDQFNIVALLLCSGAKIDLARKTGWTPLHVAVHHGNDTIVEQLVAAGADCNAQDHQGQSPIAIAAYQKRITTAKLLLKHCYDPTAYYYIAKLGNREVLRFLLKKCNANFEVTNPLFGWRAIHYAAQEGHYNAASVLAANKVDIDVQDSDGNTPLHMAILHKHSRVAEVLLQYNCYTNTNNKKGEGAMSLAVQSGNISIVQSLINNCAIIDTPDSEGKRPLIHAIERGHSSIAALLISHGASVNLCGVEPSTMSPIRLVCKYGNSDLLKLMADRGSSMEQRDEHKNTLLHTATQHGQLSIALELIVTRGSLVNAENVFGKTPIHQAILNGHSVLVETLLSAGAKVSIMDEDDTVLYEMAKHKEVWEVLRQWATENPAMLVPTPRRRQSRSSPTPSAPGSTFV